MAVRPGRAGMLLSALPAKPVGTFPGDHDGRWPPWLFSLRTPGAVVERPGAALLVLVPVPPRRGGRQWRAGQHRLVESLRRDENRWGHLYDPCPGIHRPGGVWSG